MALRCIFCVMAGYLLFSLMTIFGQEASAPPIEVSTPTNTGPSSAPQPKKRIIYREKSYFELEDTLIRGDQDNPYGLNVFRKDRVKFKSALDLKRSFIPELKSSSTDAR